MCFQEYTKFSVQYIICITVNINFAQHCWLTKRRGVPSRVEKNGVSLETFEEITKGWVLFEDSGCSGLGSTGDKPRVSSSLQIELRSRIDSSLNISNIYLNTFCDWSSLSARSTSYLTRNIAIFSASRFSILMVRGSGLNWITGRVLEASGLDASWIDRLFWLAISLIKYCSN